jgi:hypothetical protein
MRIAAAWIYCKNAERKNVETKNRGAKNTIVALFEILLYISLDSR